MNNWGKNTLSKIHVDPQDMMGSISSNQAQNQKKGKKRNNYT
jgi:hypothetical protein